MLPWIHLGTAIVPGGGELKLLQRGNEFSIMSGADALMNSRLSGSEIALAELACEHVRGLSRCRMLIGGYGMGFTLRAALAGLASDASVVVAELVPEVLQWARGPMAGLTLGCLDDRRVSVREADVGGLIASARSRFDAIVLDVDNGPEAFSRDANAMLYDMQGLRAARRALTPGGLLAVWSAGPDKRFARHLERAGFSVDERTVRARKNRGLRHTVWLATNTDSNRRT
jgi:spermidine synthase